MNRNPKVGILPLYLKLYDETFPTLRHEFEPLLKKIESEFITYAVDPIRGDICCQEDEIRRVIHAFQTEDIDLLVILHLAYSLSLEALPVLREATCPILLLDTTIDESFDQTVDPNRLMLNHGVHGVQDLACMLRRSKVPYEIIAGSIQQNDLMRRAAGIAKTAFGARCLKQTRAVRIGSRFEGMGDFAVEETILRHTFGITVSQVEPVALKHFVASVSEQEIEHELQQDHAQFNVTAPESVHRRSIRIGLGVRRMLEDHSYSAFSMNFKSFSRIDAPVDTVPFLEASKSMARGIGYAGEGDVLTASLVGALARAFRTVTFTEIFCPDWKHGALFLSHMGEINPAVSHEKPLLCEKVFPWADALNPAIVACSPAPGNATLVNIAPGPDDSFRLIVAPVDVLADSASPAFHAMVRGWIRPKLPLPTFLEQFSRAGGTHHSALVLGDWTESIGALASFLGIERILLEHV